MFSVKIILFPRNKLPSPCKDYLLYLVWSLRTLTQYWTSSLKRRECSALAALTLTFIGPDRRSLQRTGGKGAQGPRGPSGFWWEMVSRCCLCVTCVWNKCWGRWSDIDRLELIVIYDEMNGTRESNRIETNRMDSKPSVASHFSRGFGPSGGTSKAARGRALSRFC